MKVLLLLFGLAATCLAETPWKRHVIDNSSRGADGVRFAGANQFDIVTGWEEGGVIRVYRYPGPPNVRSPWPAVTVGRIGDPEDALFADLDHDGKLDVISASEGKTRKLQVYWAPDWKADVIPASDGRTQWMFSAFSEGRLWSGAKNENAELGWWEIPKDSPRSVANWKWHGVRPVGWIMSIIPRDMDGDGDEDILFSDRKRDRSGVYWLENPSWKEHVLGLTGREVMFLTIHDQDIYAAVKPRDIYRFQPGKPPQLIPMPSATGTAKGIRVADLDGDGAPEIIFSCESTPEGASGVMYLKQEGDQWTPHPVSGWPGIKYDLVEVADLDQDGDLDIITCEETTNLGVIWFENPLRKN